jgi:transcriptional pleiotropic regulator of transition state genes
VKSTGIVINVDELGRIVIPKEMRTKMNISSSDPIEIYVEGDKIILKKYENTCLFCGGSEGLSDFKGKKICQDCVSELKG